MNGDTLMFAWLSGPILGSINLFLFIVITIFWGSCLIIPAVFKFILPIPSWRRFWSHGAHFCAYMWDWCYQAVLTFTLPTTWEIRGLNTLKRREWYLIIANHQSWTDIVVLQKIFLGKIPLPKFFLKRELLKLPILGWACWVMDYPFMYRHSKNDIKKNPKLKGKDLEITRKACEKFKYTPTTIVSFAEGTRATDTKKQHRSSPYKHLLVPKSGGIAFMLGSMSDILHLLLDVTIIYPQGKITIWDYLCGKVKHIFINIDCQKITADLIGDYQNDPQFRIYFQRRINQLWQHKDTFITNYLEHYEDQTKNSDSRKSSRFTSS